MTSTTARRSPARRNLRAVLVATALAWGVAAVVGALGATPASAHDYLVSSSPSDGSTVASAPTNVTLSFNDVVLSTPGGTANAVEVTGPGKDDTHREQGAPVVDGRDVVTAVTLAGAGRYTVQWRVVSADGHPIEGTQTFTYEPASSPTGSPTSTVDTRDPDAVTDPAPTGSTATPTTGVQAPGTDGTDGSGDGSGPGGGDGGDGTGGSTGATQTPGGTTGDGATDGSATPGTVGTATTAEGSATAEGSGSSTATVVALVVLVVLVGAGAGAWYASRLRRRGETGSGPGTPGSDDSTDDQR